MYRRREIERRREKEGGRKGEREEREHLSQCLEFIGNPHKSFSR